MPEGVAGGYAAAHTKVFYERPCVTRGKVGREAERTVVSGNESRAGVPNDRAKALWGSRGRTRSGAATTGTVCTFARGATRLNRAPKSSVWLKKGSKRDSSVSRDLWSAQGRGSAQGAYDARAQVAASVRGRLSRG